MLSLTKLKVVFINDSQLIYWYNFPIYHLCHNPSLGLATKARGLQGYGPRGRPGSHFTCSRECKECESMNPHTPKGTPMLGVGVPKGLLNLQSAIARVKTHRLQEFFISLKSY
jgi:hypothetical protein